MYPPPNLGQPPLNYDPDAVPITYEEQKRREKARALAEAKRQRLRKEFQKQYTEGPIVGEAFEKALDQYSLNKSIEEMVGDALGDEFKVGQDGVLTGGNIDLPSMFDKPDPKLPPTAILEPMGKDKAPPLKVGDKPPAVSPAAKGAAVKTSQKRTPRPLGPNESYDPTRTDAEGNVTKGVLIGNRSGKMLYSFDPVDIAANKRAKAKYKSDMESGVNYGRSRPRAQIIDKGQYQDERSRQYAELYKNGSKEQQRQRKQKSDNAATAARNIAATKKFYADEAAKAKITTAMAAGVAPPKADLDAAGMTEEDYKLEVEIEKEMENRRARQTASNFASRRNRDKRTRRRQ